MESGWQAEDEGEPVYDRVESWRNMLWDSFAQNFDLTDARYMARTRWSDIDTAVSMYEANELDVVDPLLAADFQRLRHGRADAAPFIPQQARQSDRRPAQLGRDVHICRYRDRRDD